jgi:hypothetical protein
MKIGALSTVAYCRSLWQGRDFHLDAVRIMSAGAGLRQTAIQIQPGRG